MKVVLTIIGLLFFAYVLLAGLLYVFQRSFIYFPDTSQPDLKIFHAENLFQVIEAETDDGVQLKGWYHSPDMAGIPVIVLFHGNGGHHAWRARLMTSYIEEGYGVLLAGYRGYGGNPGKPSEVGFYLDAQAWIDTLIYNLNFNLQDIVLYGESLGSGVAVEMATRYDVGAVILQSPYSTVSDIAHWKFPILPIWFLLKDKYDSISKIGNVSQPLLIIHGRKDKVIPIRYGKKLFSRAQHDRTFYEVVEGGHNDLYNYGIEEPVISFLEKVYAQETSGASQ